MKANTGSLVGFASGAEKALDKVTGALVGVGSEAGEAEQEDTGVLRSHGRGHRCSLGGSLRSRRCS